MENTDTSPYADLSSNTCDSTSISAFMFDGSNQYFPFMMQTVSMNNSMFNGFDSRLVDTAT